VALLIRIVPMALFQQGDCVRDECIYRAVASRIMDGEGLTTTAKGWLAAPGYPYLIAFMKTVFGAFFSVKFVQIGLSLISVWTMYLIGNRLDDRRTGRIAAWLFAVHPTLAFFTQTMWIETIYIFCLLFAVLWVLWARDGDWKRALAPGAILGLATLFRGMATYLPPIFALAVMWPDEGLTSMDSARRAFRARWKYGLAVLLGWTVMVGPYAVHSSYKWGGVMVTDATVGHVLFLGNNAFPPLTFDYGNGMLTGPLYARYLRTGRRPCDRNVSPVISSKCEVDEAKAWIMENPSNFLNRIPMRLAQMLNPNSFFTRHLRWGYWSGIPWWVKEGLALYIVFSSYLVIVGGSLAAFARARGPFGVMAAGTIAYTFATIVLMYGMTRFRLPIEPLWMLYLALLLSRPAPTMEALRASPARGASALLTLPLLLVLMAWYLPTGFPMFW
jgi:4-amino-4-deoxy-L-arabinose transferase-like glycosyltransferase